MNEQILITSRLGPSTTTAPTASFFTRARQAATIPCETCGDDIPLGESTLCADCQERRREWLDTRDAAVGWLKSAKDLQEELNEIAS